MPDTEYIVEIYSTGFQEMGKVGPVGYVEAHKIHKSITGSGLLATITEKQVIDHYKALGEYYNKKRNGWKRFYQSEHYAA